MIHGLRCGFGLLLKLMTKIVHQCRLGNFRKRPMLQFEPAGEGEEVVCVDAKRLRRELPEALTIVPLIEAIQEQSGQRPEEVLTDNGYCSEENLKYLTKSKDGRVRGNRKAEHGERNEPCKRGHLPEDASRVERMERKLKIKVGAAVYARRKCMVEPVFGQIKQARGFRQFLLRGLEKVRGEWALICMTHNLLKFHKLCYG